MATFTRKSFKLPKGKMGGKVKSSKSTKMGGKMGGSSSGYKSSGGCAKC